MRLSIDATSTDSTELKNFANWLLQIGDGRVGDITEGKVEVEIAGDILIKNSATSFDELIDFVYRHIRKFSRC